MNVLVAMFALFVGLALLAKRLYGPPGKITHEAGKAAADAQAAAAIRAAGEASRSGNSNLGYW